VPTTATGDELRAAVERVRRVEAGERLYEVYGPSVRGTDPSHHDRQLIVWAYLREHPADSDLPVTQDWLASVGFEPNPSSLTFDHGPLSLELSAENVGDPPSVEAVFDGIVPHVNTRSAVRRLLRALGIEPKE
jgi:hypothetical protein